MKFFGFLFLFASVVACDPYGFGFKKNPAYVLDEAFKSVSNLDVESFLEVTGKEALCVYGNEKGLVYLKDNIELTTEQVKLNPKVLKNEHYSSPKFVGFWSYYNERYEIEVLDKVTNEVLLETIVDCDYGINGEKNDKFINIKPSKYKVKECQAIKLMPKKFKALPVPEKCNSLKIVL